MRLPQTLETDRYNQTSLSKFSLRLIALLILVFVFHNLVLKKRQTSDSIQIYQNIIIIAMLILSTGEAESLLAIFSHPTGGFTLSLAIGMVFLLNKPLLSSPLLINFFSTQYWRLITVKKQIKVL